MAPPPPGPMIVKSPGRESLELVNSRAATASRRREKTIYSFPLLSLLFLRFLFGRNHLLCQSLAAPLDFESQKPGSIFKIDFLEYFVRQAETVDPPPPLRRHGRRRIVEVFVFGLKKAVVNLVKLVIEDLL